MGRGDSPPSRREGGSGPTPPARSRSDPGSCSRRRATAFPPRYRASALAPGPGADRPNREVDLNHEGVADEVAHRFPSYRKGAEIRDNVRNAKGLEKGPRK